MNTPPMREKNNAECSRVPAPTPTLLRDEREHLEYIRQREQWERRSVLRGLIVMAVIVLLFSMWRAGFDRILIGRWWWP